MNYYEIVTHCVVSSFTGFQIIPQAHLLYLYIYDENHMS